MASTELASMSPALIIVEPTDMQHAGMARTDLPALPGAGGGRGAAVWRISLIVSASQRCSMEVAFWGMFIGAGCASLKSRTRMGS
jgi:hypothetical protein